MNNWPRCVSQMSEMSIANYICQNLSDPDPDETKMRQLNKKIKILHKKIKGKLFLQVTYQQLVLSTELIM